MKFRPLLVALVALVAIALVPFQAFGRMLGDFLRCSLVERFALSSMRFISPSVPQSLDSDIIRQLVAWGVLDAKGGLLLRPPVAKTANYQIVVGTDASGTCFTTRGAAGAVTFTLPAVSAALAGYTYEFVGVANQNIGVAAAAGTVVTFNNAAATSVTASTAGGKIGAHFRAICDGTSWHVIGDTVGVAYTVA
jgi:hypothetical protein